MTNFDLLFLIAYILLLIINVINLKIKNINNVFSCVYIACFSLFFLILFASRDYSIGTDTERYISTFNNINVYSSVNDLKDFGFYYIIKLTKIIYNNERFFLYFLSFIYLLPFTITIIFYPINNRLFLYFSFISMFFFESMGINIIRQGISMSLFLLAILISKNKINIYSMILYIISFSFHSSIIIIILIYHISKYIRNIWIPVTLFFTTILLSYFNFNIYHYLESIPIVNNIVDLRLNNYVDNTTLQYNSGFRIDFILFNTTFAILALYAYIKIYSKNAPIFFKNILTSYLLISSFFFLMLNIPFSDRFGILSWIFIPILLTPFVITNNRLNKYTLKLIVLNCIIFIIFNLK